MKKILVLLGMSTMLFACKKDEDKKNEIFKGAEVQVHGGKAWTWAKVKKNGTPEQLAITLNDAVLNTVPTSIGEGGHNHDNVLILPLHTRVKETTLFEHVGLDWNPIGHPPENLYMKAHFDMHFYMMSEAERMAAVDPDKLGNAPAAGYLPADHIAGGPPVPQMGMHWIDTKSPEFVNNLFTQTFIYGSYNSKVNFYEPMITLEFLRATNNFERSIPQPEKFAEDGYYPTKMRIVKHDGVTDVILEDFVKRKAS